MLSLILVGNMGFADILELDRTEFNVGDPIRIRFTLTDQLIAREIGIFLSEPSLSWMEVHRSKRLHRVDSVEGEITFPSETMEVGPYQVRLWVVGRPDPVAVTSFILRSPQVPRQTTPSDRVSRTSLYIEKTKLTVGEVLTLLFHDAGAAEGEWIGVFPENDIRTGSLRAWVYTDGTRGGYAAGPESGRVIVRPLSLQPGKYVAQLFTKAGLAVKPCAGFQVIRETVSPVPAPKGQLTIASFNIWGDGNGPAAAPIGPPNGGLLAVVGAILKTRADIVGLQECSASRYEEIVAELRKTAEYPILYSSISTRIVSRFPITREYLMGAASRDLGIYAHGAGAAGVKVRLSEGIEARFFNCHLSADPVGPLNLLHGKRTKEEVVQDDRNSKAGQMQRLLDRLVDDPQQDAGLTTSIVGDLNSPSHLDWGENNVAQNAALVVAWPTSRLLIKSGFTDLYRKLYPDPRNHHGFTYTNGYPKNVFISQEMHERIDFIYYRNGESLEIYPVQFYLHNEDPYPSDHRMVVAGFDRAGTHIDR